MEITNDLLKKLLSNSTEANRQKYLPFFNKYMQEYGIESDKQVAAFFAQIGTETGSLSRVDENLNYSAKRLLEVFPKYFNSNNVAKYANQPAKIASRAYANRIGNGSEESGDGWKYRGRGLIQVTGKANYIAVSKGTGIDCINNPDLLVQPEWAVKSACWWWHNAGLNKIVG